MPQPGDRISEYVLESPVGRGAFGEVWRARHHVWQDQRVAIKFPADADFLRHLQREGLVAAGLGHPNIVRPLGFDPFAQPPYLVMEYVEGYSLRAVVARGPVTVDEAVGVMRQMLSALEYAHAKGVVHRDLKPENVLLAEASPAPFAGAAAPRWVVKLADFALARPSGASLGSIVFSRSLEPGTAREVVGSLEYMSPEQRAGETVDGRADVYSVGVIWFEMLTAERPVGAELPSSLNPAVPAWADELFRRACARIDRRFASAAEVSRALESQVGGMRQPTRLADALPAAAPTICPQCRNAVREQDQFCMYCGVQLVREVRRCANCGGYPAAEDQFCRYCGRSLSFGAVA